MNIPLTYTGGISASQMPVLLPPALLGLIEPIWLHMLNLTSALQAT